MIELMAKLNRSTLIIVMTLFSVLCSIVFTHYLFIFLGTEPGTPELIVAIVSPLLIAPVVCWWLTDLISKLRHLEEELRSSITKEKEAIYVASIMSSQHVVNNLLNQLQLVELEVKKHPNFDKEVATLFEGMLGEAKKLMSQLSSVKQVDAKEIIRSVSPKKNDKPS